jgi:hypothetical protein
LTGENGGSGKLSEGSTGRRTALKYAMSVLVVSITINAVLSTDILSARDRK